MRRVHRAFAASLALAAALFGCEVIVSSTVPDFRCTPGDPSACPESQSCDPTTLLCVAGSAFSEAGVADTGARDGGRTTSEASTGPAAIGAPCTADTSCSTGLLCGTSSILTTSMVATGSDSVCTKTCCTSADCPDGFLCFGAGTGGNYCVAASRAQRTPLGTAGPGATCGTGSDCRSGLCTDGHCVDTCCDSDQCATGTSCLVRTVESPAPGRENWICAVPDDGGTIATGSTCSQTKATCKDNNCSGFPAKCRPPCCSSKDCVDTGFGFGVCAYGNFDTPGTQAKWCFDKTSSGKDLGESCTTNTDCASLFCDPDSAMCAAVCCQDSDCDPGTVCRPAGSSPPSLRCVTVAAH